MSATGPISGRRTTFTVESAGCAACAARVRAALSELASVEEIVVDETADEAVVRLDGPVDEGSVARALERASEGSGHTYRVKPGSWHAR